MNQQQWTFVNKSSWPRGEWDSEPDKVQWIDPATNLDCLIHRGSSGALCGYVGLPRGHKFYGKDYEAARARDGEYLDVHGGLTFADSCSEEVRADGGGICHIPAPGRPADVWWLGFDCAHSGDLCPAYSEDDRGYEQYRDIFYVKHEVQKLAAQLSAVTQ